MADKPTYEELELKIKKLEKEAKKLPKTEEELKRKITELNSFINNIPAMAWLKDTESRFTAVNREFGEAVGMNPESLINQTCEVCFGKEEAKKFREDDQKVMKSIKRVIIEEKIIDSQKNDIWLETIKSPILDESRKVLGTVGIANDITKNKETEEGLRESQYRYSLIFNGSRDAIFLTGADAKFVDANDAASVLTGYSKSELKRMSIPDLHEKADLHAYETYFESIMAGKPALSEAKILKKDGTKVDTEFSNTRITISGIPFMHTVARDITDRKQAEKALRESEERYRAVVESQTEMICRFLPDWTITFVNDAYCHYFDKDRKELIGHKFIYLIPESDRDKVSKGIASLNPNTPVITHEHRVLNPNGEICWHKWTNRAIFDDQNTLLEYQSVGWDINKRYRAEKALRESENQYRRLVETMNDGIGIQDENGLITYVNNKFCQMLDYKLDDFIGKPVTHFLDDHNRQILKNQTSIRKKGKVTPYEIEWICKNGRKIQTIMSPQAIFDDNGQFKGSFSVITDISILKQVGDALWESKEQFRNLTEITSDWIWEVDKYGFYTYVSPKVQDMLGYKPKEIMGETPFDLMPPAEAKRVSKIFNTIVASRKPFDCLENINLHKNGHPVVLETSGIPTFDADGAFRGYRGIDRDITARKQVEKALSESEERYRSLAENSMVGFWQITLEGYTTYINPAMCSMIEIESLEELSGQTYHSFFSPESLEMIDHERATRPEGRGSSYEAEIIGKNGGRRNVMICGAPLLYAEDKLNGYIATFTDITDRKRAEKALKKAHDQLEHRVKKRTKELEIKTNGLKEINTAMTVLLKKREEDKIELEDNVLTNVKELVEPYFKKIKKTKLDDQQEAFLSIIESNLKEIISPFTRKMSLKYLNLTPTEIRIANLIKHGSSSKRIAELQNVSPRTIDTHRKNIRRKIGIQGQRGNLRSHLLSLH